MVQGKAKPLLGAAALQEMELIFVSREFVQSVEERSISTGSQDYIQENGLIKEYQDIFKRSLLDGELHLVVDKGATPVKLPVCKMPLSVKFKTEDRDSKISKSWHY